MADIIDRIKRLQRTEDMNDLLADAAERIRDLERELEQANEQIKELESQIDGYKHDSMA